VAAALYGLVAILHWQASGASTSTIARARNFYGFLSVREYDRETAEHRFQLRHGGITHGEQLAADNKRHLPLTYYSHESGVGRAIGLLQGERPAMRVGVVGLGVGSLAAYARQGDVYRFYEINPEVQRLAEDRRYFSYLSDARQRGAVIDIAMGDARLSLDREPPQQLDVLALDAFSGDSIPAHLLTREALAIYGKHLATGGVIAVHCTNTYLYLAPVVRGLAEACGLGSRRVYKTADHDRYVYDSDWFLLTDNRKVLEAFRDEPPPPDYQDDFRVPLWTDRYSNLFQILQ
jgi:spermidine synthase